eukprot:PITA_08774
MIVEASIGNIPTSTSRISYGTVDLTLRFTVGEEIATFLVSCEFLLPTAWKESLGASITETFTLNEYEDVAYVAFPSFDRIEDFIVNDSQYGEGNIQTGNEVFSGCLKGNDNQLALVHQGALKMFLHIMENTDFKTKLQQYMNSKQKKLKPIIFVGHSLGGAVATLVTLWVLEKRLKQSSPFCVTLKQSCPFCITFGCPLVGDERLVQAVGRENWRGNFCHVVSQHDIVPRMFFAQFESIAEHLTAIFPYWQGIKVPDAFIQDACRTLLNNVLGSLRELDGAFKRSPYMPFGTYMFCSSNGATCIENPQTVLKMLHWTMQSQEPFSKEIVQDCLLEHISYGSFLENVKQKSIRGRRTVNSSKECSYEMGISLQLEAIGDEVQNDQAKQALLNLGRIEHRHSIDVSNLAIKLSKKNCTRVELEWYKECCEKDDIGGYYDSFKNQYTMKDIDANGRRLKLGEFWDEIIEMWENHALPSDFQSQNKWVNAGMTHSQLVEPLDIAYYYRKSQGKGNYFTDGRPKRYKILQKWLEEKEKTRKPKGQIVRTKLPFLIPDTCFWAHVEEALKDLKQGLHQKGKSLKKFEEYVTQLIKDRNISSYVFLEKSSFMRWWQEYKQIQSPEWKLNSSLYKIMESESWKG